MGKTDGPVYAVKVDNTGHAHPQVGLSKADVVYVEQVEGGVTRLAAIYSSEYPKFVGPVRSGRITDIDLLRQYGTVGLIYSGSQNKLADNLQRADLKLVSFDQDHTGYTRSPSRPQPYDVIGTFDRLRAAGRQGRHAAEDGLHVRARPGRRQARQEPSPSATRARGSSAVWSPAQKRWLVSMDGVDRPRRRGWPARPDDVRGPVRHGQAVGLPRHQRRRTRRRR